MTFSLGDRVRWATIDDDGLPVVRYGFVGAVAAEVGPVMVMLDGELSGDVVQLDQLEPVTILNVKLHFHGRDLIEDPELRRGLVHLWRAEAESAGLDVDHLDCLGTGEPAMPGWALGSVTSGGREYLVKALPSARDEQIICIRAENR
ncbi:MAG: hypothetical protein ACRDZ2_02375 [Ilumatobacteraceae bacterium]